MVDAWRLSKSVDDQLPVPRIKVSHGEQWIGNARQKNHGFSRFFSPKGFAAKKNRGFQPRSAAAYRGNSGTLSAVWRIPWLPHQAPVEDQQRLELEGIFQRWKVNSVRFHVLFYISTLVSNNKLVALLQTFVSYLIAMQIKQHHQEKKPTTFSEKRATSIKLHHLWIDSSILVQLRQGLVMESLMWAGCLRTGSL